MGTSQRSVLFYHCKTILYTETTVRVSSEERTFPFPFFRKFSFGSRGNRQGGNQSLLFCLDAGLHTSLERVASAWSKSLSIPVRVPSANSTAATRSRRAIAYPKLNLAAGRPRSLASSARIANQRATETGPKRHASPILI